MSISSQQLESYVPVYDAIPENWEDARPFVVEQLKKITNSLNVKEIGFFLDEELLSGKSLFSKTNTQQFRTILRKVIDCSPLTPGANSFVHGIVFDANFTLVQMFASATNSGTLVAEPIPNSADTLTMNSTVIIITVAGSWDRCLCVIEYTQEV